MATIKSYTDLPQSKILSEFLPIESADMHYKVNRYNNEYRIFTMPYLELGCYKDNEYHYCVCVWSLATLLNVLPPIEGFRPIIDLDINLIRYEGNYHDKLCFYEDNLIDACVTMIKSLHELNLL